MILVDSSAWVEYYRPTGLLEVKAAVGRAIEADLATVNGVIQVEILAFAPGSSNLAKLISDFKIYNWIELNESDFDFATEMGFFLRKKSGHAQGCRSHHCRFRYSHQVSPLPYRFTF